MKISSRLDYALSCVLRIADKYDEKKPISVSEVAKKEKLETDYVEQLLIAMKKQGILKSVRGAGGGYILALPPNKTTVDMIVKAIDREILEFVCFRKRGRRKKCIHIDDCRIRSLWSDFKGCMESFLKKRSLEELLRLREKEKNW